MLLCVCVCVCGFVVSREKTVFKRHRRRERKKSFLHLPSARCNGFKALQRSKPREAGGCRCLQSPELRVQESFTDTIAFNQLFSGEIAGVIMEFLKNSKGGRAGGQPIRHKGEKKLLIAGAGNTRQKPSTFKGGKEGEREGKGSATATEGGRSKCDPESAALRLPHANSTPSAALTNDF